MSFGPTSTTKTGENNLSGTSNLALNSQFPQVQANANNLLSMGSQTTQPGVNFLTSLLSGNKADTTAALQPNIDQIRQSNTQTMTGLNTLTPRGGGRSGTLFQQSFAPQGQIQNLFNSSRVAAATALPQIGLAQSGLGAGLFNTANGALGAANSANSALTNAGQQQQQITSGLWGGLGKGLFGLATTPFGGGAATNGLLGML